MNDERRFLRQAVATVAYRAGKAIRGAPAEFATFTFEDSPRTPLKILAHMGDLYEWALHLARGEKVWNDTDPVNWDDEVERFYRALRALDDVLASEAPLGCDSGRLFAGPIADSLTHTGQIAMLRRMFGAPIRGENYFRAEIEIGRVGPDQAAPKREFD